MHRYFCALVLALSLLSPTAAHAEPLRLGAIAPLSGDFAPYGGHIREGIVLAQESLKERGIETTASFEDACLPKEARAAVEKLIATDRIQALVGSYCVIGMVPSAPLFDAAGILAFHTSEVPRSLLQSGKNVFTTNARIQDEARVLAEYAYGVLQVRRVGVLSLTTQWGQEFDESFTEAFTALGGAVVAHETTPIGQSEFRAELTRIRSKKPQALFIVQLGSALATALVQSKTLGMEALPLLVASDGEEEGVLKAAKGAADGLILFAPEPAEVTPMMEKFELRFAQRFGHSPHPLARHAYDATVIAAEALNRCAGANGCVRDAVSRLRDFQGASGNISIDRDRGTTRQFVRKTAFAERFVRADSIETGRAALRVAP